MADGAEQLSTFFPCPSRLPLLPFSGLLHDNHLVAGLATLEHNCDLSTVGANGRKTVSMCQREEFWLEWKLSPCKCLRYE